MVLLRSAPAVALLTCLAFLVAASPAFGEEPTSSTPPAGESTPADAAVLEATVADSTDSADATSDAEPDPLFDDFLDDDFDAAPRGYPDPAEATNRGVLAFNRVVDSWLLDPATEAYQFLIPTPARIAIARLFVNLGSTKTLVNDLLQLEWMDAGVTAARLVVNTSAGIGGLFDVGEMIGLEGHESDFGQTLALAGTPSGPYIVVPVLGPSNIRDGFGTVVDGFFQPTYYILGPSNWLFGPSEILLYSGSSGLSARERQYAKLKALEDSSIDFYAAMRSGFYQDRSAEIWSRRDDHRTTEEPDYSEKTSDSDGL